MYFVNLGFSLSKPCTKNLMLFYHNVNVLNIWLFYNAHFIELTFYVKNTKQPSFNTFVLNNKARIVGWSYRVNAMSSERVYLLWSERYIKRFNEIRRGLPNEYVAIFCWFKRLGLLYFNFWQLFFLILLESCYLTKIFGTFCMNNLYNW